MTFENLDGEHRRIRQLVVSDNCDAETAIRAFSVLCGAAAEVACRLQDGFDLGREFTPEEREEWYGATSVLLRLSDLHTPGQDATRAELLQALGRWWSGIQARMDAERG